MDHTFKLYIDLRDQAITKDNVREVTARLLRDAADRIELGHPIGGFNNAAKGSSFGGGFHFDDSIQSQPPGPPQKEVDLIIEAVARGALTRDNREEWRRANLSFSNLSQFDSVFEPFMETKEASSPSMVR